MSVILDLNKNKLIILGEFKTKNQTYKDLNIYLNREKIDILLDILTELKLNDNINDINTVSFYSKGCATFTNGIEIDKNLNNDKNSKKTSFLNLVKININDNNTNVCYLYYSNFKNNLLTIIGDENKLYKLYYNENQGFKIFNNGNKIFTECPGYVQNYPIDKCICESTDRYRYSLYFCIFIIFILILYLIYINSKQSEITK